MTETMNKTISETGNRRSGLKIMSQLIVLVKPLLPIMLLAVIQGVLGFLCAIFLTIVGGMILLKILTMLGVGELFALSNGFFSEAKLSVLFVALFIMAVLRGVLHYGEQYCNHYIAFKLLAIIRHKVFAALRKLCPAKLEGRDKGNLISIITSDIELLEVFYAHTISPIVIGIVTSIIMVIFIGFHAIFAGILAACAYIVVGAVIPLVMGKRGAKDGMVFRNSFGDLNSFVLDSLRGLDETIQYRGGEKRKEQLTDRSNGLAALQKRLNNHGTVQGAVTNVVILGFSIGMLFLMVSLWLKGAADFSQVLIATIAMMGSFGPVVALASLSNNLNQTLASGERVLSVLEEEPEVYEVFDGKDVSFAGAEVANVNFAYGEEQILHDVSLELPKGKIVGIHGVSGSGKSTLLKLLMRFWDVQGGKVTISGENVRVLNTSSLRDMEAYVTQETVLFHDSIANNIGLAKEGATREEIMEAAKKASIHNFIMTLPKGYDTPVGELGDTLSGGERQRIGIARAFLHDAPFMLLDEPTSNLDSLNEGIILKSLQEERKDKTIILVSHRKSTMGIADVVYHMDNGRKS